MNALFSQDSVAELFIQSLISHWFVAIILVTLVGFFVSARKSLNATTRHNIWLITLVGFVLMPILVFMPKPSVNINLLDMFVSQSVEQTRPVANQKTITPNYALDELVNNSSKPGQVNELIANQFNAADKEAFDSSATVSPVIVEKAVIFNFPALLRMVLIIWLIGSLYLVRKLWGEYKAARELELQSDSVTPYFERRFKALCERLEIKEQPLLRFHPGINAPMTVGLMRVWVAIPMTWREEIDDDVFDQTLTHELGHIARKDPLVNTIQRLMNIVFWMYPAFWYVARQLELERESACDDWVLTHDGKGHTYANNLLNVAESLYLQPHVLAVGCLRSHSQLSRRIQNLLNKSSDHAIRNSKKLLLGVTVAVCLTLSVSAVMWPDANEYLVHVDVPAQDKASGINLSTQKAGSVKAQPDTQVNFSDNGMQVLVNGVEVQDAQVVHDPLQRPEPPAYPVRPKVVSNFGGNTHNYAFSEDSQTHSNVMQTNNGKYGSGSLSIKSKAGKAPKLSIKPAMKERREPLLHAAWTGDWLELKRLIKKGEDVNTVYKRPTIPRTAINAAILQGNLDMVEFLYEAGAEINAQDESWDHYGPGNALTVAAMVGNKNIARYLVKQGAKPDDATLIVAVQSKNVSLVDYLLKQDFKADDSLAIVAVQNRDEEMLDVLLKHDVAIDDGAVIVAVQNRDKKMAKRLIKEADDIDNGALIVAIQNRDQEMVDWLLDAGADADDGALVVAVQNRDKKLVRRLLDAGADIDDGALVIAIQSRDQEMIDWLLDAGADPDDGALVMAVQNRNKPLVKRLLKAGADIDDGALVIAIQNRDDQMIDWLLNAGADPGDGALVMAVQNRNKPLVKSLLKAGADIDDGALIIALQSRDKDMVQWLLDAGADPDDGALIVAIQNKQTKIAKQLLDAGADIDDGALIVAIQARDRKMVAWLLDAGAEVEDGALIVAMQSGDEKIIKLIQKEYKGDIQHDSKDHDWNSLANLEVLRSMASLKNLEKLEQLGDLKALEKASEKFGEQLGEEIATGVVNFIGDMAENGGNLESIALVKALEQGDAELAMGLLKDGAIPNTLNITQALENGDTELVKAFLKSGAKPNGLNILQALENEETDLAMKLMKYGAKPNGIVLIKAMEMEDKKIIETVRSYMRDERAELDDTEYSNRKHRLTLAKYPQDKKHSEHDICPDAHKKFNFSAWPVSAKRISSDYGESYKRYQLTGKAMHNGIDFPVKTGQKIKSVADGVVVKAKYSGGYGNYLIIDHGNGYKTLYANNKKNLVKVGQLIKRDQTIATVGNSGDNSRGPHLHFEVLVNGSSHNPHHYRSVATQTS